MNASRPLSITGYFGVLRMTGATRLDFVQRMSSGDVAALKPGEIAGTCFTTPNGRIVDWTQVLCLDDALLLLTGGGNQEKLRRWLSKYVFFNDDVRITDESGGTAISARVGTDAIPDGAGPLTPQTHRAVNDARIAALAYGEQTLVLWLRDAPGAPPGEDIDAFDRWRIAAGVPRFPNEVGEAYIPLEAGLWSAVSFRKGCYIGQEIIARMESRNRIAKKLALLESDAALSPGAALSGDGARVGVVTSCAGLRALAYVQSAALDAGAALSANGVSARVIRLAHV